MTKASYKVLITTSGVGSQLSEYTKYTNKALIKVGRKPVLSYIIEAYPKGTEFVITLGHFAEHVKEFIELAYPNLRVKYIDVNPYQGKGSSLCYSMLQASKYLQEPFIYHASDTIVFDKIPKTHCNWIAGYQGMGSSNYTSFNVLNGRIQKILEKGIIDPDYLHIGLVSIYDYKTFWKTAKKLHEAGKMDQTLSDYHIINEMLSAGDNFVIKEVKDWHDTGNIDALQKAKQSIGDPFTILDKPKESIFFLDKYTVKFFYDKQIVAERVKRAEVLASLVPKISQHTNNFYKYNFENGDLYADVANPVNFSDFLTWSQQNLWKETQEVTDKKFKDICYDFYYKKTQERVSDFFKSRGVVDKSSIINGERVPSVKNILKKVDYEWLSNTKQTYFHGDYILDNIIKTAKGYCLLDWRQNFGGLYKAGDMYYDLSKLNHNLVINHAIIMKNLYTIMIANDSITCDIYRRENLVECQRLLFTFIKEHNYDAKKVSVLTGINWLNQATLHHHPFDLFLFYFGKLHLWRAINEQYNN